MSTTIPGRFNRLAQKLLSTKGGANITDAGSELLWMFPLDNGVENRYLLGWDRFAISFSLTIAGAGNFNALRMRNPGTSGVIAVFEKIKLITFAADSPFLIGGTAAADLTNPQTLANTRQDSRGRPSPTIIASSVQAAVPAALTNPINRDQFFFVSGGSGDVILDEDHQLTLLPGDAIQIQNNTVNLALTVAAWWRERALEDSEKT